MKKASLKHMTTEQLVERFALIAQQQDEAIAWDDNARYTRLFWQMEAVDEELKSRPGDARRDLLLLFTHKNPQVRLAAAKATFPVAPNHARKMLEEIRQSGEQPYAGDAGMSLFAIDEGLSDRT